MRGAVQTYTHVLIGACLGAGLYPADVVAQASCALGAGLPDVVQVPKYLFDKLRGIQALADVSPNLVRVKNVFHSILVWGAILGIATLLGHGWVILVPLVIGGFSHPFVDAVTHKDEKYWAVDAGFLWPLPIKLARYTGLWEYRIDHGVLRPKPLEGFVCAAMLAGLVWLNLRAV